MKYWLYFFIIFFISCHGVDFSERNRNGLNDYRFYSSKGVCPAGLDDCDFTSPLLSSSRHNEKRGSITEYFNISERNELEILLVLDASKSMDKDLKKLGANISSLLQYISDKNWRMAFITADHGDHRSVRFSSDRWEDYIGSEAKFGQFMNLEQDGTVLDRVILTGDEPGYKNIFEDTLTRKKSNHCSLPPYCHGKTEQPLRALKTTIQRYQASEEPYVSFFQDNVDTIAIIITDEDERTGDTDNATTAEEVIQEYQDVFADKKKRLFGFSISIQDEDCYKKERSRFFGFGSTAAYGRIIGRLAELTDGKNVSLCEGDYGNSLEEISHITRKLVHSLVLQKMFYIPDTVEVSLFPEVEGITWTLQGRRLVFSDSIPANTQITVNYRYDKGNEVAEIL